jgi:hypothetical protein
MPKVVAVSMVDDCVTNTAAELQARARAHTRMPAYPRAHTHTHACPHTRAHTRTHPHARTRDARARACALPQACSHPFWRTDTHNTPLHCVQRSITLARTVQPCGMQAKDAIKNFKACVSGLAPEHCSYPPPAPAPLPLRSAPSPPLPFLPSPSSPPLRSLPAAGLSLLRAGDLPSPPAARLRRAREHAHRAHTHTRTQPPPHDPAGLVRSLRQ